MGVREGAMLAKVREKWAKQLLAIKDASGNSERLASFAGLTPEQASRASYFTEMAELIQVLGIANPHERTALSIEPTHPVSPAQIRSAA